MQLYSRGCRSVEAGSRRQPAGALQNMPHLLPLLLSGHRLSILHVVNAIQGPLLVPCRPATTCRVVAAIRPGTRSDGCGLQSSHAFAGNARQSAPEAVARRCSRAAGQFPAAVEERDLTFCPSPLPPLSVFHPPSISVASARWQVNSTSWPCEQAAGSTAERRHAGWNQYGARRSEHQRPH